MPYGGPPFCLNSGLQIIYDIIGDIISDLITTNHSSCWLWSVKPWHINVSSLLTSP